MLRKFRIKSRLLLSFFIVVLFTLTVGLTGFVSLTSIGNLAVKTINNVSILNDIYDHHIAIDAGVFGMLYVSDATLTHYVVQTTKEHTDGLLTQLKRYLEIQDQFSDVFTPGEMQDIANLFEICEETYVPVLNEVFNLVEQSRRAEALAVYINRLIPIFDTVSYYIYIAFDKNLKYSVAETSKNSESSSLNAYLMLAVVFLSLIVSILMAFFVTKSIAVPLTGLGAAAEKVANGELDVQFEQSQSNDEITSLSQRLQQTMRHLNKARQIEMEAVEARHEKEKAEASSRSKGEFLAKMSHEIRTPMNAITGMAELALREDMPDTVREHVLTIKQAGANLLSIINDILDFSKIESGKLEIIPADYMFSSLVNDVLSIIRTRVIDLQIRFTVNIDCNIPDALFGDETRIRQIFLNILSNAVKYTEQGFVSLTVTGETTENTVNLTIKVTDSGKGIRQEDIERLFGEFVQIDLSSNRGIEGTGLGLAITRNLVQAMGGNISVESEFGKGSTFTVTLPQKIRKPEKLASVENPAEKSVLLYEKHEIYADSVLRTLDNLGVECTSVCDYIEFCEKMASETWPFIFISFDLFECVSEILNKFGQQAKVVLLAKFGEVLADKNMFILALPAYSIPIANALNGVATDSAFSLNKETASRFTAPEANVLVVDDINTNLKVAEGLLLPYKMQVELCSGGRQAIDLVRCHNYDIVFMDHMMPEMDGIEATATIRALEGTRFKTLPIIALTANAVAGMREMFMEKGFNDFLDKPINVFKLDEILDRWVPREKKKMRHEERVGNRKWGAGNGDGNSNTDLSSGQQPYNSDHNTYSQPPIPNSLNIPGVDTKKGITMTGGTEALYRQVLAFFCEDAEERLPLLQTAPGTDTLSLFVTQVHALKSAAASIGAAEISAEAARLEIAGKAADFAFIRENLKSFAKHLDELDRAINAALRTDKTERGNEAADNFEVPFSLLRELESALKAQNASEIDRILDMLKEKPMGTKTKEAIEKISDAVLMAEFDIAKKTLEELAVIKS